MITVFSRASLPMERGVGRIYSQSRGRGHRKFFWGLRPQTPSGSPLLFSPPNPKCAPRSLGKSRNWAHMHEKSLNPLPPQLLTTDPRIRQHLIFLLQASNSLF